MKAFYLFGGGLLAVGMSAAWMDHQKGLRETERVAAAQAQWDKLYQEGMDCAKAEYEAAVKQVEDQNRLNEMKK